MQVTDADKVEIARVLAYACEHKTPMEEMEKRVRGEVPPVGDNSGHGCELTLGQDWIVYRAVFSFEEQPVGLCAHFSMSCSIDELPSPQVVEMVAREFGLVDPLNAIVWKEKVGRGKMAVNVLEPVEESVRTEMRKAIG